jgi:Transposase DDE domain group 1
MAMCNPRSTSFGTSAGRKVLADFSGGQVTSDTGALLLRDADRKLGLLEKAAKVIPDPRDPSKIEHSQLSVLQQRVYGLVLGYEDVIDHDALCQDFVLQTATGRAEKLAGASTVGRLELRADRKSMWDLHKILLEDFFNAYESAPGEVILDLDSTDFTVHGM